MTALVIALLVAVVVVAVIVVLRVLPSRRPDGVATFRRQIDALSPEARRPVVEKVQRLEDSSDRDEDDHT